MRSLIFFYLLTSACIAQAKVNVQLNQELLDFAGNPRLVKVLAKVSADEQWFWPATTLYRLDSSQAEKQRSEIVAKLEFLHSSLGHEPAKQVTYLIEQIKQWTLADRIVIAIDYDAAQMNNNNNLRFENGNYRLDLKLRPTTASIFGVTIQDLTFNLTNNQCAYDYIHQYATQLANIDFAYIIQPNGTSQKIGIAYWNKGCVELMPGSQIYLPLPESQFFKKNRLLNEQIVALAKNRIVL
jgi:hypothetical protein